MHRRPEQLAASLNQQSDAFKAFLITRVGSAADAEDILQNSLIKAFRHAGEITDPELTTAWFYRVLRNAIIDHYRSQGAARRRNDVLGSTLQALGEDIVAAPPGWTEQICGCLGSVVNTLKPQHAELLRRVDLDGESVQTVAHALGITPNNASVALHRARKELRIRLERFCGACAAAACLDCECRSEGK